MCLALGPRILCVMYVFMLGESLNIFFHTPPFGGGSVKFSCVSLTSPSGQSWSKAAVVLSKVQDQVCLALVPHLKTFHTNTTTVSCAMICHCNNKIKYYTNTSIGKPGFKSYIHSH